MTKRKDNSKWASLNHLRPGSLAICQKLSRSDWLLSMHSLSIMSCTESISSSVTPYSSLDTSWGEVGTRYLPFHALHFLSSLCILPWRRISYNAELHWYSLFLSDIWSYSRCSRQNHICSFQSVILGFMHLWFVTTLKNVFIRTVLIIPFSLKN